MITVRVTCDTGRTWVTGINGTFEDARAYFMGHSFSDESEAGIIESRHTVVDVTEVDEGES